MRRNVIFFLICLFIVHLSAAEENNEVIGWRHNFRGEFPDAEVVTTWSPTENVIWRTRMDKWSNASPVIVGDKIFICEEPTVLVCLSAVNGDVLWRKTNTYADCFTGDEKAAFDKAQKEGGAIEKKLNAVRGRMRPVSRALRKDRNNKELKAQLDKLKAEERKYNFELKPFLKYLEPKTHGVNGYSSLTPVSDGTNVYVLFGNDILCSYDLEGNRRWIKRAGKGTPTPSNWGRSSSPVIADGKLIAHIDTDTMYAFNMDNGEQIWESKIRVGWGTPQVADIDGLTVIVSNNGEVINPKDGKPFLARGLNRLEYNSAVVKDGVAYFIQAVATAHKLKRDGNSITAEQLWKVRMERDRYYASPLIHEGLVYDITQKGILSVLNAADGQLVYKQKLQFSKGQVYTAVTLLGDNIFLGNEGGTVYIIEPGGEYKEVARFEFEKFRSCPVAIGNKLYIRTLEHMYCIGKK